MNLKKITLIIAYVLLTLSTIAAVVLVIGLYTAESVTQTPLYFWIFTGLFSVTLFFCTIAAILEQECKKGAPE